MLPGIEGRSRYNRAIRDGLADGGVDYAIEIVDWTARGYLTALYNLRAEKRNRHKAAEIAGYIVAYQKAHPAGKVVLVGQSGGTAMAAWTAEALPDGCQVDGIVMLASALSPSYPLDAALSKSRRGIVSSYSPYDWFYCGMGTTLFGTSDGQHVPAAGKVGFQIPSGDVRNSPYGKLFQIRWRKAMVEDWNLGGHLTSGTRRFTARRIAPLVAASHWDRPLVENLAEGDKPLSCRRAHH